MEAASATSAVSPSTAADIPPPSPRLQLAPTARTHLLGDDTAIVDDHARLRLEGGFAAFFDTHLRPLLSGDLTADQISDHFPDLDTAQLQTWLARLVDAGVLQEVPSTRSDDVGLAGPGRAFYRSLGLDHRADEKLRTLRIGIVGYNRCGRSIAGQLTDAGVNTLIIVDPTLASSRLEPAGGTTTVVHESGPPTKDTVQAAIADCDLVVHAWGDAHFASAHWCNQWALATGAKALFCTVSAHRARVGPLVLPGESSCLLCYRMRSIATDDDYELAITDESWRFTQLQIQAADRAAFPAVIDIAAAVAATEIIKVELGFGTPALIDHIWELDPLTLQAQLHPVLQQPQCPACRKKVLPPPAQPTLQGLSGAVEQPADLLGLTSRIVDRATGLVTTLAEVPRDPSEPPLPLIYRAELPNHRFLPKDHDPTTTASGKGMTAAAAQISALGEAIERYGAVPWHPTLTRRASANDLPAPYLSPDDLVTYTADQYTELPYARWQPDTVMDWVPARRLTTHPDVSTDVWVPALGTYLEYQVHHGHEFFFPATSNGLAAGPTLTNAILSGLLELLERDAFLLSWMGSTAGTSIDPAALADPDTVRLYRSYARRHVDLRLVLLPTDTPVHVCVAIGADQTPGPDRPAAVIGLGADLDPTLACRKAALEVGQVRPAVRARLRDPAVQTRLAVLLDNPLLVTDLDDHDLLFADPRYLDHLRPWLTAPPAELPGHQPHPGTAAAQLTALVDALDQVGVDVCYVDLTPPDVAELGLSVARVHGTGLQPIHFGAHEARLAGPRVQALPKPLHLFPHPLA